MNTRNYKKCWYQMEKRIKCQLTFSLAGMKIFQETLYLHEWPSDCLPRICKHPWLKGDEALRLADLIDPRGECEDQRKPLLEGGSSLAMTADWNGLGGFSPLRTCLVSLRYFSFFMHHGVEARLSRDIEKSLEGETLVHIWWECLMRCRWLIVQFPLKVMTVNCAILSQRMVTGYLH